MITIKTFEGKAFEFEEMSVYKCPGDRFSPSTVTIIRFKNSRVSFIYYESGDRCGHQHLGYDNLKKLYPYKGWYESLIKLDRQDFMKMKILLHNSGCEGFNESDAKNYLPQ